MLDALAALSPFRLMFGFAALLTGLHGERAAAQAVTTETVVIFRHGEKPPAGLGQLTCQGLNRALALPGILARQFAQPSALFAPDPSVQIMDGTNGPFSYVRPVTTLEPTAISLGLPVNTQVGYMALGELQSAVTASAYASATVFVTWEHGHIPQFAKNLLTSYGGNPMDVPAWEENDYNSIYVVTITTGGGNAPSSTFELSSEGLPTPPLACPSSAP